MIKISVTRNKFFSLIVFMFIAGCLNHEDSITILKRNSTEPNLHESNKNNSSPSYNEKINQTNLAKLVNNGLTKESFLKDCSKWEQNYLGALQGLAQKSKDSTSHLCFSAYYKLPETYEVIFAYKGGVEKRKLVGDDSI